MAFAGLGLGLGSAMEDPSWELSNAELIQQLASLVWVTKGDDHKEFYEKVTGARVAIELYKRLSGQREADALQTQVIVAIATYIKEHPKATEAELVKEVTKQIEQFKQNLKAL